MIEVFGRRIEPGRLIHADKHGFLVIPEEDEDALLDAARFMDSNECSTVIPAARSSSGKDKKAILEALAEAGRRFSERAREHFRRRGEW
jgi:4-hydroxy-4-methyl-2-oxoglutarate aldolase